MSTKWKNPKPQTLELNLHVPLFLCFALRPAKLVAKTLVKTEGHTELVLVLPIEFLSLTTSGKSEMSQTQHSEGDAQHIIHCCLIYSEHLKQNVGASTEITRLNIEK